ncbi:MAG: MBL fold metallo-hydrolase [Desulfobacterales bacterium]|jgi:glyoxylase-like metal-dependent hydrolase (beta-lactamase superfamily II)
MIELFPNIFYVPGQNNSRYPYCACLYLKGQNMRVLIDAGMGASHLAPVKKQGIDILILTHCHIDHRLTRREIPDVPVWCHEADATFLNDRNLFYTAIGLPRSGLNLAGHLGYTAGMFGIEISHYLDDEDRIDLGGITLETIHTPGHTPGHLAFFIPEADLLFAADVDLTSFGPFYGHDFADIDDFLRSIERLKQLNAGIVATGHSGPFNAQVMEKFDAYEEIIYRRDRLIHEQLTQPRTLDDFRGHNLIFRAYPDFPDLIRWFELVHIEKHLERLKTMGKVRYKDGKWSLTTS